VCVIRSDHQIVFTNVFKDVRKIFVHLASDVDAIVFENIRRKLELGYAEHARTLPPLLAQLLAAQVVGDKRRPHGARFDAADAQLGKFRWYLMLNKADDTVHRRGFRPHELTMGKFPRR
jgi:hypothetical protein